MDRQRLRRGGGGGGDRRAPRRGGRRPRRPARPAAPLDDRGRRRRHAGRARPRRAGRGRGRPPHRGPRRRPGHGHLHQRHHRPAQGLRADPPQPALPGDDDGRRAAQDVQRRRLDAALPAAGAHLRPDGRGRRRAQPGPPRPHRGRQAVAGGLRRLPAHLRGGGAAGLREGLQRLQAARARRRQGQDLRPRGPHRGGVQRGPGPRPGAGRAAAAARADGPAGLLEAAGRARRPVPHAGSPAAPRSAPGSGTSSAASG